MPERPRLVWAFGLMTQINAFSILCLLAPALCGLFFAALKEES